MSRKSNCWDNAVAESFFGSLKKERIKKHIYKNRARARADVADYIDAFYNRTRRHGHVGGMSPEEFEAAQKPRRHRRLNPRNSNCKVCGQRVVDSRCVWCLSTWVSRTADGLASKSTPVHVSTS